MKHYSPYLIFIFCISLSLGSCNLLSSSSSNSDGTGGGTAFMWIGADKDAYVSCGQAGPPCSEEELNFGQHGILSVARNGVALKKIYVHFSLPDLPSESIIEEAYLELYHPGQNEDGQTDDINIPVALASGEWSPATLTLKNEPNIQLSGMEASINLNSAEWSGTGNIAGIIRDWYNLSNPSSNNGFYIYWNQINPGIEKGFYSNNDIRRNAGDLGLSPRLLLRIKLPDGSSSDDINPPPIAPDNDLNFGGQEILVARISGGGNQFPSSWNVRRGN